MKFKKRLIVLSSPSGGGKSTLAKHLFNVYPELTFSVSCTTRAKRKGEHEGKDYYFLSVDQFLDKVANKEFAEYEEIFGNYYGTLKSEIIDKLNQGKSIIFDVDVKGAVSLKKAFPEESLLIFIYPPSLEVLKERLHSRKTEEELEVEKRVSRFPFEMSYIESFDFKILNDDLIIAKNALEDILKNNI